MFISTQIKKLQIFLVLAIVSSIAIISCNSSNNLPQFFPVQISEKIGFINNQGKLVIDAKFEATRIAGDAPVFSKEGLVAVRDNSKCGYIDTDGKIVISFQYDLCKQFSEGLAFVQETIKTPKQENGTTVSYQEERCSYIDKLGSKVIDFNKNGFDCSSDTYKNTFSEGLSTFQMKGKIGFMDKSGKIIIQPQFYDFGGDDGPKFSEGLALVITSETDFRDRKVVYIDKTGKVIISANFAGADDFSEGLAGVRYLEAGKKLFGGKGYIDTTGKIVIEPKFESSSKFLDGLASFTVGGKFGYIDKIGKIVVNPIYDQASLFSEGLAAVKVKDKFGFIDKTGRMVIEPTYQSVGSLHKDRRSFYNGLALVGDKDGAFGYIDKSGNYVWKPTK